MGIDPQQRKTALRMIGYNIYVIGCKRGEEINAFTGTWLAQASFEPPQITMAARRDATSCQMIEESGVFTVNFIETGQKDLAAGFFKPVTRVGNKFGDIEFYHGENGCPILKDALAYLECQVVDRPKSGDHQVFLAEVVKVGVHREGVPLSLRETGWSYGG